MTSAERAALLEMIVEYAHVETGRLCVDLHACAEHGKRRKSGSPGASVGSVAQ